MKKHPFLTADFHSTLKLSDKEFKLLEKYLSLASEVFEKLIKKQILKGKIPAKSHFQVSLLICGDVRIRKLNKEHRGKDKVTDVLSFPATENLRKIPTISSAHYFLGDLAICLPQALRQAKSFSIGTWDEFIHLYFHGLIHLLGFDHELSPKEEKLMQTWEDQALSLFSDIKKGSR